MAAKVAAWSAPGQQSMGSLVGVNVAENMFFDWQDGSQKEHMVKGHTPIADLCKMACCPLCCCICPFQGDRNKIEFRRECDGLCACPYAVYKNQVRQGKVQGVGCLDNGCYFCMCGCINCTGHVKMMSLVDNSNEEKIVFTKGLYPCWTCVQGCAMACAPLGALCMSMRGCYQYLNGEEFMTITQPVYAGPWTRQSGAEPEQIGDMKMAYRFQPIACCCATATPLKIWYDATTERGAKVGADHAALLSVILATYRGLDPPIRCCVQDFQQPTGVSCLDLGLGTKTTWRDLGSVMKDAA